MGALFKSRPLASLLMEKQFSIELCSLFTSAVFTNRSYYSIRIISANHPVCFQKAAIDDSIRKFPLKGQSCTNAAVRCSSVLQTVPLISLSQRNRSSLQKLQVQPVLKWQRKSLGATQKNLPDIRMLPEEALKGFQAGDWIEG